MPSPSVTLWTMKPTIRNVPSASSPTANDEPMARPSPRLCRPMPTAIRLARASPWSGCPRTPDGEPRAEKRWATHDRAR